ncbi:MAG: hypothetical protein A3K19_28995 [Lentisphaerae bacterium RIFOXYB12_FULL_65_16]|nr:MAG: hypothetical protein A3K18_25580 [Lentisphaerae bacterium RIFOXYA12_64_32]OGV88329.1 MAG: hypothetical protein A3K19_28995 [Lentisphaerae bacterium RIFOXYB12_FULL_65_16]
MVLKLGKHEALVLNILQVTVRCFAAIATCLSMLVLFGFGFVCISHESFRFRLKHLFAFLGIE